MTLATPPLGRTHHFWGQFADAASLPNVAGSPTQSPPIGGVNVLQAGDVAWSIADTCLYTCITPTTGVAVWRCLATTDQLTGGGQLSWGNETIASSTTPRYLEPWFSGGLAPTTPIQFEVTRAGTLRSMYVRHNNPGGSGAVITYTLRVNGIATALTVALASTSATGSDLANSVVVAAGDTVDIEVTKAATAGGGSRIVMCEVEFA